MKSNRKKMPPETNMRLRELEEENALLRSELSKREKPDNKPDTSWIEDSIARGLAFVRKESPDFEDKGALNHFVRAASSRTPAKPDLAISFMCVAVLRGFLGFLVSAL